MTNEKTSGRGSGNGAAAPAHQVPQESKRATDMTHAEYLIARKKIIQPLYPTKGNK